MKVITLSILYLCLNTASAISQIKSINEGKYISIGGIEQWVTIQGDDVNKPVVLFLHGGPGSVMSPYESIYGEWKKDFILVNWDQRGAGRTFGRNAPAEVTEDYWVETPLTIDQMTSDGIELTEYLLKVFGKQKVILIGTSWGSILGTKMSQKQPDLFYAYIGHSQVVNFEENLKNAYHKVFTLAKADDDKDSIEKLEALGAPPYADAKKIGQMIRLIKKYEKKNIAPAPNTWEMTSEYDNEIDAKNRYDGDDYSFINFIGHEKLGIEAMSATFNFMEDGLDFKIPVFLVQGEEDILTSKEMSKAFFDRLNAPKKEFFLLPKTAHGHNQAVIDTQYKIVTESILINGYN